LNKELLDFFDEVEQHHWWWEGRRQVLRQSLGRKKNTRILDVGCGTGETMTFLEHWLDDPFVFGVDNSSQATRYARSRSHDVIQANAFTLPFEDGYFDYVLLLDVMEHIEDDLNMLLEANRVIHSGGRIIITVPALEFLWSSHDLGQGHFRRYTRSRLIELAKRAGFKIEKLSYFNFFFSLPIMLIRLLSRVKVLARMGNYDNPINYSVAHIRIFNEILKFVFLAEIKAMRYFNYPWGISLHCVLSKQE
jgi:ubiquinone/menaquinone biosynthesis C-methylase UbiE